MSRKRSATGTIRKKTGTPSVEDKQIADVKPPEDGGPLALKLDASTIRDKKKRIHDLMIERGVNINKGNFTSIGGADLRVMFELYDEIFFNGYFADNVHEEVLFSISRKMTRAGGKTVTLSDPKAYVIKLSSTLLFQSFDHKERKVVVNGVVCHDRLEAAMCVMEHEIIHLLELVNFKDSSCSKQRFASLCLNIFGHTDVKHDLVTGYEYAHREYGLKVGDTVSFEFEGNVRKGIITRITKRATVMVKDRKGRFQDDRGNSFSKYYIPLRLLKLSR
ncbi:MAG: hypothetical protein R6V01_03715 [Thermoplasmatota archaeon]